MAQYLDSLSASPNPRLPNRVDDPRRTIDSNLPHLSQGRHGAYERQQFDQEREFTLRALRVAPAALLPQEGKGNDVATMNSVRAKRSRLTRKQGATWGWARLARDAATLNFP